MEVGWELESKMRELEERGFAIMVLVWEGVTKGGVGLAFESGAPVTIGYKSEFVKEEGTEGEG